MLVDVKPAGDVRRNENYHSYNELVKRAVGVNRIAPEEYFRVLKSESKVCGHPIYQNRDFYSNYTKQMRPRTSVKKKPKFTVPFPNHA